MGRFSVAGLPDWLSGIPVVVLQEVVKKRLRGSVVLRQLRQEQFEPHPYPRAKHSQYFLRHLDLLQLHPL